MSFRAKLLALFSAAVAASVALAAIAISITARRAFERLDEDRVAALVAQFRREFERRGQEVARRVEGIAEADSTLRLAIELSRPDPDYSPHVYQARELAAAHALDFLELAAHDGTIVSSAHWPARFGYRNDWVVRPIDWKAQSAFLRKEELAEQTALALVAVRVSRPGDRPLYVMGGQRLGREFLASLVLPAGMRALLYANLARDFSPDSLTGASQPVEGAEKLAPLVGQVRRERREASRRILWSGGAAETFHAIPLAGRDNDLLAVFLVGSSRRELEALLGFIRRVGAVVGGAGILLGVVLSYWAAARVTRPVARLAAGARQVADGDWEARVEVGSRDEIGELGRAFNRMTGQLREQRERLLQAERVAAWRELARRLAHELKNPLFPMQITVENLQRAREQPAAQFEEVFRESTATLLAGLASLKAIVGRFSDFARMPKPEMQEVDLNQIAGEALKLFEAQIGAAGVTARLELDVKLERIQADAEQLRRAIQNLALNALDAMPSGGALTIRTRSHNGGARLEVSDTGAGLTPEERERLFTPYYTSKQHGTGLGLAIVQSVVSDHGGKIWVESEPGRGATFHIDLPARPGG